MKKSISVILLSIITLSSFGKVQTCRYVEEDFSIGSNPNAEVIKYNKKTGYFRFQYEYFYQFDTDRFDTDIMELKGYANRRGSWSDGIVSIKFKKTKSKKADYKFSYRNLGEERFEEAYITCK